MTETSHYPYGAGANQDSNPSLGHLTDSLIRVDSGDFQNKDLVAVIPAYNEQAAIGSAVIQAHRYVDRVIVVDDNSTDKTSEIAKLAGADVIRLHIKTGKAYALLLGLKSARELGSKAVVVMDAQDGQYYSHDIPKIAAAAMSGDMDLVIGSHYSIKKEDIPFSQKFKSSTFNRSKKSDIKKTFADPQSNFRAFSRKALENLDFKSDGYNIESDIITHFLTLGFLVSEIPLTNLSLPHSDSQWGNPLKILAAMPAYNEEKYIAKTVVGARKYVDQVLIVDDGSTDTTKEIAKELGTIIVSHEKNSGYGAALQTIFNKARELHVDALVILDADGQHNPEEIGKLLEALVRCDVDVVIGSRFIKGNDNQVPGYRKVGMKVLDGATRVAGVADISDSQSGFRAYGKRAIDIINPSGDGMSAGSEILIQISDHNLRIAEVPIDVRYDIADTSTIHPLKHGIAVLSNIIGLISYRRPLPAFGIPGFLLIVSGLGTGFWAFAEYYTTSKFPFVLSMGSALLLILGLLLVIAGLILNTLVIILKQPNKHL
jgi:glycosyltransferase involved in cell wall biosynthesis